MDGTRIALLMVGIFFLAYGLLAYRFFFAILGGAAGLVTGVLLLPTILKKYNFLAVHKVETTLVVLLVLLVGGMLLTHSMRKVVMFLGGVALGIILAHLVAQGLAATDILSRLPKFSDIHAIDALVGVLFGVLFIIFESVFAVVLTSFSGAFLCTWALGGKWTFLVAFLAGLVIQPLLSRFVPLPEHAVGGGRKGKKGKD